MADEQRVSGSVKRGAGESEAGDGAANKKQSTEAQLAVLAEALRAAEARADAEATARQAEATARQAAEAAREAAEARTAAEKTAREAAEAAREAAEAAPGGSRGRAGGSRGRAYGRSGFFYLSRQPHTVAQRCTRVGQRQFKQHEVIGRNNL